MHGFTQYTPTRIIFGKETQKQAGELAKSLKASKVFVVYGGGSVVRSGLLDEVIASLEEAGLEYMTVGGVKPNPRLSFAREAVKKSIEFGTDFVLAVGGGSVIDTSKAVAHGTANPDTDIWEFWSKKRTVKKSLPVGVVLTLAAAGSETSDSAVLTNEETKIKRGLSTDFNRPAFAIMNPELTYTLPKYQVGCGIVDIMMHTMERYFTNGGNMELTDAIAEGLLRTVMTYAKILHTDPENYEARAEVMWAGSLAHNNLTGCGNDGGDFATHMLEHEMGGMFDVTHGAGLAAIWPSWARYVCKDALPRFERYARNVMGVTGEGTDEEIAEKGIQAMESFYREINMPTNMQELGIKPTDAQMREMAKRCAAACGGSQGSAKVLHEEDMYEIYKLSQ